jgi:formate dehydrogenase major subunit
MTYARLEALGGIQWPCWHEDRLEPTYLHGRLWADNPADRGRPAPFSVVEWEPPVDTLSPEYPIRLTTGRRLDSYNTGVQSRRFRSPLRFGETIDLSAADVASLGLTEGETVRVSSRRGSVLAPVRVDPGLRAGLAFMTMHFPDEVDTNQLTIEANDPKSGTAEFKASAIRIDRV